MPRAETPSIRHQPPVFEARLRARRQFHLERDAIGFGAFLERLPRQARSGEQPRIGQQIGPREGERVHFADLQSAHIQAADDGRRSGQRRAPRQENRRAEASASERMEGRFARGLRTVIRKTTPGSARRR